MNRNPWLGMVLAGLLAAPFAVQADVWQELFKRQLSAAEAGDADAQYEVSAMYLKGRGVAPDRAQARAWLEKAAAQGHERAESKLARMKLAEEKFREILSRAQQGDPEAAYEVGVSYMKGIGTDIDYDEAGRWLGRVAETGQERALFDLGYLYYKAVQDPARFATARRLFEEAASKGNARAAFYLGEMYAAGDGGNKDLDQAANWYRKAAEAGLDQAKGRLLDIEEERAMARRRAAREAEQARVAEAEAKAAKRDASPGKAAPPRPARRAGYGLEDLTQARWQRGDRPLLFLPSAQSTCEPEGKELVCYTENLTRERPPYLLTYRTKSRISPVSGKGEFTVVYRNLVVQVDKLEAADEDESVDGSGYDSGEEKGFAVKTGWTREHRVSCHFVSHETIQCVKDGAHHIKAVAAPAGDKPALAKDGRPSAG